MASFIISEFHALLVADRRGRYTYTNTYMRSWVKQSWHPESSLLATVADSNLPKLTLERGGGQGSVLCSQKPAVTSDFPIS